MAASLGEYMLKTKFTVTLFAVFALPLYGASDVATDTVSVFVMKGDSLTLHTNITINQRERFKWYFIDALIAQINGDLRYICTDVKCNKEDERFRDRLKLDHQSGDLTITNINTSDNGIYRLQTFSSSHTGNTFKVVVNDVPTADMKRKSLKEGESVTLDTPEEKNPNALMTWHFNGTRIAEITGGQTKICEDVQCRFRDRLKLDHQTGSLIITNTRTTDSGLYELQIKSSRNRYSVTSIKSFSVSVTDSGLSLAVKAGIYVAVVLMMAAAVVSVILCHLRSSRKDEESPQDRRGSQQDQCEDTDALFPFT